jgi:hypothetical protein
VPTGPRRVVRGICGELGFKHQMLTVRARYHTELNMRACLVFAAFAGALAGQPRYDLLLKGGHVIDARNRISAKRDVAIAGGKIAEMAADIPAESAVRTVDVSGLYVTPGLVDIHVHVYAGTGRQLAPCADPAPATIARLRVRGLSAGPRSLAGQ